MTPDLSKFSLALLLFTVHAMVALPSLDGGVIQTQTFNDLSHGQIVDNQFSNGINGFTVRGTNVSEGPDLIVAFDTFEEKTADSDLEDPFDLGNAHTSEIFRDLQDPNNSNSNVSRFFDALIIQENGQEDLDRPGFIDSDPDDEGSRPAGTIQLDFESPISRFGFDLLDVENVGEEFNLVFSSGEEVLARVPFEEFVTDDTSTSGLFFDETIEFGNNSANRIVPITSARLRAFTGDNLIESFDQIAINLGGSGAVDNILFENFVPEPTSAVSWLMICAAFVGFRRRQDSTN